MTGSLSYTAPEILKGEPYDFKVSANSESVHSVAMALMILFLAGVYVASLACRKCRPASL